MMIPIGTQIQGKWTANSFRVEALLGQGANGAVYLVRTRRGLAAMKVCEQSGDIALEWALLDSLRNQSAFPKPMVIDDAAGQPKIFFYVMEWIPGQTLSEFMTTCKKTTLYEIVSQILTGLGRLHRTGKIFCDVKPENILISTAPTIQARFVDVGGVTPSGRAVRQFTPFYDRAFWGLGSRQADAGYDLCGFTLALVLSCVETPPPHLSSKTPSERKQWLEKTLKRFPFSEYIDFLKQALLGRFPNANSALAQLQRVQIGSNPAVPTRKAPSSRSRQSNVMPNKTPKHHTRTTGAHQRLDWTEWVMWLSLCSSAVVTVAAWASFLGWL